MRLIDIESDAFLSEMREKQNAVKELINESETEKKEWTARDHWESVYGIFVEMVLTLRAQPTVDAVPVVHGRWIKRGYACGESEYKCSVCGETEWRTTCERMKYCMFCGAKMDGEADDDR